MVQNNIEQLLEKYNNAETTIAEEVQLRKYFLTHNVPPHLAHYKSWFTYVKQNQSDAFSKPISLNAYSKTKAKTDYPFAFKKQYYAKFAVAATVFILLGIAIPNFLESGPKTLEDYSLEDQKMYLKTKTALAMFSNRFNEGASSLSTLAVASKNMNTAVNKTVYISKFSETTNQFLKHNY